MANDLTQRGLTAARVGETNQAHRLLSEAIQQHPDDIEAWLGLAGVVDDLKEKEWCFKEVLALVPDHQEAQAALSLVQEKLTHQQPKDGETLYCYRHPETETGLRCNRCNKSICAKCAKRTPVGFRCSECIREQEDKYYTGSNSDYLVAAVISFPLAFFGVALFTQLLSGFGFFGLLFAFFGTPVVTGFIAEAVRWGVSKRRSRYLGHVVAGCIMVAGLPFILIPLNFFAAIVPSIFVFVGATTVLARLR
ncbi:tetratricopeptide repeat protein [Anaerolineales bacterium HSG6]|nr:tetratricopeptide repeat protein [Anaerolineales bacterium HSG6]MDM8530611.1 tetratricopeptide repeat protein [Anaerolineales bacterium HSG25]